MERRLGPFFAVLVSLVGGALLMIGPPEREPGFWRAVGVAVVSCAIFCVAFVAFAWSVLRNQGTAAWVVGVPAVLAWEWLTAVVARRFALRS